MYNKIKLTFIVIIVSLCFSCTVFKSGDIKIRNLRCEYMENPLGIDVKEPRLSWTLESDRRGQVQTAYEILVASSDNNLKNDIGDLWASGKVNSDQSVHVIYKGKTLISNMQCFWKVKIWDKDGKPSKWSKPALWSMGLLNIDDWKAQWIGWDHDDTSGEDTKNTSELVKSQWIWYPEDNPDKNAEVGACYLRRSVHIPSKRRVVKASILTTADNEFSLWMNGIETGNGNNYNLLYELDVLPNMRSGENTFAVKVVNTGDKPNPAGFICCIQIEFSSGQKLVIHTDEKWLVSNIELDDWELTKFDDSKWIKSKTLGRYGTIPWCVAANSDESRRLSARYLRNEFSIYKKVNRAVAYVSGLGLFEFHLNGKKIGNHVLEPGLTEYTKRVFYVTFDITKKLKKDSNAVGVILGSGRYYSPRLQIPTNTRTFGFPKLLLQLHIEYEDNSSQTIVSDKTWKLTVDGPILTNNEYDGEEYDAQMEMPGWDKAGFDESEWRNVELVKGPEGILRSQMMEPIRITETVKPVSVSNPEQGMYIFDMGQNLVGWCRLKVKGAQGTKIIMRHAETLKDDGTLYLDNIRSAKVTDIYTLKGNGTEVHEPRFTYHGFRYVEVTGFPGEPGLEAIEGCVVHDDVEPAGTFECSNQLINRIHRNIKWGVRGNYRSFPTDCPQRDERQAWLGDRAAESKGETYLYNIAMLYGKWMADINDSQKESGSLPVVAPPYWPMYFDDVTWPSCYIIIPGILYEQYGDVRVLNDRYPSMKKWMEYMSSYLEDGIMPRDQFGDWCVPPESPDLIHSEDPNRRTAKPVLGSTYFYKNLTLMAQYANILGKPDDEKKFHDLAEKIKEAFNKKFFKEESDRYDNGSQTSFVLPLSFGIVPEEKKHTVFNKLVEKIMVESKGHIGTGLIGGQWLMRVLSDNGRPDIAYQIATQKTYPSWGYMIENNATTIWELWNGNTANPAMNSHNHVMLVGDLNIWLYEYLAGIRSDVKHPGFKRIIMRPHPIGDLTFVRASYKSVRGVIKSAWKIADNSFIWDITVPVNTTAEVYIPAKSVENITESGKSINEITGVKFIRMEGNTAVVEVASGSYRFISENYDK